MSSLSVTVDWCGSIFIFVCSVLKVIVCAFSLCHCIVNPFFDLRLSDYTFGILDLRLSDYPFGILDLRLSDYPFGIFELFLYNVYLYKLSMPATLKR